MDNRFGAREEWTVRYVDSDGRRRQRRISCLVHGGPTLEAALQEAAGPDCRFVSAKRTGRVTPGVAL